MTCAEKTKSRLSARWVVAVREQEEGRAFQAMWPTVVADLTLGSGDVVEMRDNGRETRPDGTTRPCILLTIHRCIRKM